MLLSLLKRQVCLLVYLRTYDAIVVLKNPKGQIHQNDLVEEELVVGFFRLILLILMGIMVVVVEVLVVLLF